MKMIDNSEFAHGTPVALTSKLVAKALQEGVNSNHAWVVSLPIAAAIFHLKEDAIEKIATNRRFDALALGSGRQLGFDLSEFINRIYNMRDTGRPTNFECWRSPDPVNVCELEISIACFGDNNDHFLMSVVDRTAESISRASLRREMMSDSLTGFANRTGFEERLEHIASEAEKKNDNCRFAMLIFDLARFSRINESVGVLAGDELIITVAHRLNARIRSSEILARLSGNEFALFAMVNDDGADGIESIAKRVAMAFADPCKLSNLEIQVECAIAGAIGVLGVDDPMDTLRHAQIALKRAKTTKKFELFSDDKLTTAKHRFAIETDLRRAIARDELQLHYQPLIDLDTGKLNGFEALARWNHPDQGFISPMDFIPVAEESGLIVPLGRWALAEAAKTISAWDKAAGAQLPVKISVNLSAEQLKRDDVTYAVEDAIRNAGVSGERLILELTESALVDDPEGAKAVLDALKGLNTSLAMDDFGTGYSNLAFLQKLPIDVLKIDRSFITNMMVNKDNRAIVSTILSLASALGMKTTAEGIETEEISAELKGLGCTHGQGYFYAKPLPKAEAYEFLMASRTSATH